MHSTMQDRNLLVSTLFRHGEDSYPTKSVIHYRAERDSTVSTFRDIGVQTHRLARALTDLGVGRGDVVATLCWNTPEHLAAYFAVPGMGAVLHTLNLRLHDDQLVYIINHARDRVVIVTEDLLPQLERLLPHTPTIEHIIVIGGTDPEPRSGTAHIHRYDEFLAATDEPFEWPDVDEHDAAVLCYTTGTTGNPKGVAYSHRSIYLHTMAISAGSAYAFSDADKVMPVVPMFHANAWGWPHAAWMNGSDIILTDRYLQAPHLTTMITTFRATAVAAVPTLWSQIDDHARNHTLDLSSLRLAVVGGSALSPALAASMREHHDVLLTQGWGMTETSPLVAFSRPPHDTTPGEELDWVTKSGRILPGVFARAADSDGRIVPRDGTTIGEIELSGPTITGSYLPGGDGCDDTAGAFHDGWLRTGDLGVIHPGGWVELKDRLKDGIKSGGEWISSIELENTIAEHPAVREAVVVGVPDPRWEERPFACVVIRDGHELTDEDLNTYLASRVAKWWIPEKWSIVSEIPKTSVGKMDKRRIRKLLDEGEIQHSNG
ncbi:fatty-acid--CoA ligase [Rhodococcus sp. WS4]|nr:fatty-acid--CoA ligase [Rhodococcus sp. WS4]